MGSLVQMGGHWIRWGVIGSDEGHGISLVSGVCPRPPVSNPAHRMRHFVGRSYTGFHA